VIPLIEGWVLGRADGVKLLFPGQVAPFEGRLRGKPVAAFPCRVNIAPFLQLDEDAGKPQILFAGFPFYLKGVDVLIAAFKAVAGDFPDWELKILGWYPDTRVLKGAIGSHPRIFHHPPVYPPEMPRQMQECSIFVLPSRTEAMGRALVEAMAAGKACVGSDVEGIPGVLTDGVDGLLFPVGDVAALSARLRLLMGDAGERRRLGAAARDTARGRFSDQLYFQSIEALYLDVIGSGGDVRARA
jgi:glycosyltransferase involved in cell wall biosynthesis